MFSQPRSPHSLSLVASLLLFLGAAAFTAQASQEGGKTREAPPHKIPKGQACTSCHEDLASVNAHAPARDGQCTLCHVQLAPDLHTFDVPNELGRVVCVTCHELPERSTVHEPYAERECTGCHFAHVEPTEAAQRRYLLRLPERELCAGCHERQATRDMPFVHGPVASAGCTLCHVPHNSKEPKLLRQEANASCLECHESIHATLEKAASVHPPVIDNCTLCHEAHSSEHRYQLRSAPKEMCLDCHQPLIDSFRARPVFHEALVSNEGCANCHVGHGSPLPHLLKKPVGDLCLECHDKPIKNADGSEVAGLGQELSRSKFLHGPIKEGNCDACHDPHGSVTFSLLRDPYPQEFYSSFEKSHYDLCFRCHDPEAMTTPLTETATLFRNGEKNLHFLHVNQEKGRTCRACHRTHASNLPKHMSSEVPFGNWAMPIGYKELPGGGSCAPGCHEPQTYEHTPPLERTGGGLPVEGGLTR